MLLRYHIIYGSIIVHWCKREKKLNYKNVTAHRALHEIRNIFLFPAQIIINKIIENS